MEGNTRIGQRIGNYRISERVSSGSFGSVYKAEHIHLKGRVVAIKLLHAHLESPSEQRQFTQEAQFLAQLEHPYILPLIDFGFSEHQPYLITRYAPGGSLRHLLRQQKQHLPFARTLSLLQQVGQALQYAHDQQIIHRDLKPENILFNEREEALLADFGIAMMLSTTNSKHVTAISGTPSYMAPEQFQGIVSKQNDQYALACIAYELFTGRVPFTAPDFFALGFQHLTATPVPLHEYNKQIPLAAEMAILKALAKQRTDRYPTITTFLAVLAEPFVQSTIRSPLAPPFSLVPTIEVSSNPVQQKAPEKKSVQRWVDEGNIFLVKERYEEALAAYEQALALDPTIVNAYINKGFALHNLQRYEEAVAAYKQALALDPTSANAYTGKGFVLNKLQRYEEALASFEQALAFDPAFTMAYTNKGVTLRVLQRYEEALTALEQAIALDPTNYRAHRDKVAVLIALGRHAEAGKAYARFNELVKELRRRRRLRGVVGGERA